MTKRFYGQPECISALAISADGKWLLSGGMDETGFKNPAQYRLWEVATGQTVWTGKSVHRASSLAFSGEGKHFAAASGSPQILIGTLG
jgi:WD40 repeat protein